MCVHSGAYEVIEIPYSFTKLFYLSPLSHLDKLFTSYYCSSFPVFTFNSDKLVRLKSAVNRRELLVFLMWKQKTPNI